MILDSGDVIFGLQKAKEIAEQYKLYTLAADRDARSVDDLVKICGEYLEKTVRIRELNLPAEDRVIRAMFAALADGTFEIYVLAELGERERRFVLCKELFHVVLDQERCRSMDIYRHLEEATASFSTQDSRPNSPVAWEILAEVAAMEFLFPYAERAAILLASNGNPDFSAIARRYGIPQAHIENYLSQPMMDVFANLQW
ncbi:MULTISPECIES: ImmA/IrrE family metallo-endopeptidase [unclassified Pseudoxanthomonas]|uniref:ImmA/IrrE family metallo-endopeptidase n=1 Tax=unclassified Pseudoxanthomonas TaxID=2645906 RepID=UPI00307D4676